MADLIDRAAVLEICDDFSFHKARHPDDASVCARTTADLRDAIAALPAHGLRPPFHFDRYINGVLMAEGVTIERERNFADASRAASRIASKGPNSEAPVLVLAALAPAEAGGVEAHDEQLAVWADELMADLVLNSLMDLVDHDYDTKVGARRMIIDALKAANQAKVPQPEDDPAYTGCGGTGITYQTERRCACQPPAPMDALVKALDEARADILLLARQCEVKADTSYIDAALAAYRGEKP